MTCPGYIYTEQESDVGTDVSKTQVNKRQIFNEYKKSFILNYKWCF